MSRDKEMGNPDYLVNPRTGDSKPFSFKNAALKGASIKMEYEDDPKFKDAQDLYANCMVYATAYTETMLTRAKAEDPEVFAVKGMSKHEMQTHLVNNMCLPYSKFKAKMFRETTARINEKNYLNDDIRRLYNGGDKFHPYF